MPLEFVCVCSGSAKAKIHGRIDPNTKRNLGRKSPRCDDRPALLVSALERILTANTLKEPHPWVVGMNYTCRSHTPLTVNNGKILQRRRSVEFLRVCGNPKYSDTSQNITNIKREKKKILHTKHISTQKQASVCAVRFAMATSAILCWLTA